MGELFPSFDDFWKIWPKKAAKKEARKVWAKLKLDWSVLTAIRSDVERRIRIGEWEPTTAKRQYIPNPATYLNAESWEDEQFEPIQKIQSTRERTLDEDLHDKSWVPPGYDNVINIDHK